MKRMKMVLSRGTLRPFSVPRVAIAGVARVFVIPAVVILAPGLASACEVCYGAADSPWIDATRASVWLLLAVTASVQAAFAAFFLCLRSRMKAAAARSAAALVEEEGAL